MNKTLTKIGLILLIGTIGVQTFSCSSDNGSDGDSSSSTPSSSSVNVPSSSSAGNGENSGTFPDSRDGKTYKWVEIGEQTWMAENLNYNASGSTCNGNVPANCVTYGRLYDWSTAMGFEASCNNADCVSEIDTKHRGVCPEGWHLPSNAEWDALYRFVAGDNACHDSGGWGYCETVGTKLRSKEGWGNDPGADTDAFGFSALPGGYGRDGYFYLDGDFGYWWSATQVDAGDAYIREINYNFEYAHWDYDYKSILFSVRCLKD
ncbi:MAG: fibrobacter succinogenes major paralogous domain-containing protein [Fibromonadaceae bacterium]|nr:fibrobacter succinogenes major paralogous domain-containing protein [Fibromonadaceae bacterium]